MQTKRKKEKNLEQSNSSILARLEEKSILTTAFWNAHEDSLFDQKTLCAVAGIELSTAEAYRSRGGGPAFIKLSRRCLYQKKSILKWLGQFPTCRSTADFITQNLGG